MQKITFVIGEIVSGRKNSKQLQNMFEQKRFENSLEVKKFV